jgi:hypothetical protein
MSIPMPKTATITLGGQQFAIKPFNIGELERLGDVFAGQSNNIKTAFAVLRLAMERAEPKIDNIDALELDSFDEVIAASNAILELAGLKKGDTTENPPEGAPPAP